MATGFFSFPRSSLKKHCLTKSRQRMVLFIIYGHYWLWWSVRVVVQPLSCVQLFVTPWTAAHQASLSFTISRSLLKLMSIKSMMPSNHLILCHSLLLLPSILFSIRVFFNESALCIGRIESPQKNVIIFRRQLEMWTLTELILYIEEVFRYFLSVMVLLHIFKGALPLRDVSWNFCNKMVYLEFASK